ncbi:hypothetical protein OPT61_g6109 [Boeremia exigua]|uniref:Uncharacterized protein n=1 Tax=Boeremia exigua TaxID=749465 RepID=A0ACC2I7T7_9PLEO|nr:hypothetical protein OPT61_g6109 [Boeremia exigua]
MSSPVYLIYVDGALKLFLLAAYAREQHGTAHQPGSDFCAVKRPMATKINVERTVSRSPNDGETLLVFRASIASTQSDTGRIRGMTMNKPIAS